VERSGVEAVGPAPAGDDVGLFGFEGGGGDLDGVGGAGGVVGNGAEIGGDPGEIERGHGTEEVIAIEGAEMEGEGEVVDDARPEVGLHDEGVGRELGELFEGETRLGGEDEGPDLLKIVLREVEALDHGMNFGGGNEGVEEGRRGGSGGSQGQTAGALPVGGLGFDVAEERACDGAEEGVEIILRRRCNDEVAGGDFADGEAGDRGFGDGPEERGALIEGDDSLGGGEETLRHAGGESGVDGEGKVDVGAEESSGEGIEESGVDEGVVGAGGEAREGEVDVFGSHSVDEAAEEWSVDGSLVVAEEDDGAGAAVGEDVGGGGVIAGGENPADLGEGSGVGDELKGGPDGGVFGDVGGGDEDGFVGKDGGDGLECGGECVGWDGGEADEDFGGGAARGGRVGQGGVGDGGDRGHRDGVGDQARCMQ